MKIHICKVRKKKEKKKENITYSSITKNSQVENEFKATHMLVIFKNSLKKNYTPLLEFYIHHFSSGRTLNGRSAGRDHMQKNTKMTPCHRNVPPNLIF